MVNIRRQLLGLGFITASSIMAMSAAHAMTGQSNIKVDGGPLGQLEMSGGFDAFGYTMTNNGPNSHQSGTRVDALFLELQKTTGVVQFTVEMGNDNGGGIALGTQPSGISPMNTRSMGPVKQAFITIAPTGIPLTFSAGVMDGLEGYESSTSWQNVSLYTSALCYTTTSNQLGVNANYTQGPVDITLQFGDVADTKVFNFLSGLGSYTFNSNNVLSVYFGANLGRTGVNAHTNIPAASSWSSSAVGSGNTMVNGNVFGTYYSWTHGNLNLVPEVQYAYAKPDQKVGITKFTSNFGAAVFGDYSFANTPYSVGGWVAYEKSLGSQNTWFLGPNDESIAFAVSPTWQYKYLYVRGNLGIIHLLHNTSEGTTFGFGNNSNKKTQVSAALETGFVF